MGKYIIELDDDIANGIRGENECEVEPREIVRSFQATIAEAIASGKPYDEAEVWRKSNELLEKRLRYLGNPTNDCISREALKDEVRKHAEYYADRTEEDRYNVGYTECACEILDFIDNAPTISPY